MRNIKIAIVSLRASRWRSLMTMTGIILGIISVITTVSLGEGLKREVIGQMNRLGSDLITVRPGNLVSRDSSGNITKVNQLSGYALGVGSLSPTDLGIVKSTQGIGQATPLSIVSSGIKFGDEEYNSGPLIATTGNFPEMFKQEVAYGVFFEDDSSSRVAVVGKKVAEELFKENVPVGLSISIRGKDFIVTGVFSEFENSPLMVGMDLNKAVFIPSSSVEDLGTSYQLAQIVARPADSSQAVPAVAALNRNLKNSHGDQEDFTVLRQDENLTVVGDVLNLFTAFITGVAALSLLIGGIGIMNIMFVSVTERTREIGIRKAVGATNRQIRSQFFIEATVLSGWGGVIGIILSFAVNGLIRVSTHLEPVITPHVIGLAGGTSIILGILFGIIPAIRAARKDPIEALRYE